MRFVEPNRKFVVSKRPSFTFCRGLWPKSREQNFSTDSRHWRDSLGKCQGYRKEAWLLRWDNESQTIVRLEQAS